MTDPTQARRAVSRDAEARLRAITDDAEADEQRAILAERCERLLERWGHGAEGGGTAS